MSNYTEIDVFTTPLHEQYRLEHIHHIDGKCVKNRHGERCPPRVYMVADDYAGDMEFFLDKSKAHARRTERLEAFKKDPSPWVDHIPLDEEFYVEEYKIKDAE